MLDDRVAQDEVEGCVRVAYGLAQVGYRHPICDLRVKIARLQDVLLNGVQPKDVVSVLPVEVDVAGACAAACVQAAGPGGDKLPEAYHQVGIAFEARVGGLRVDGLNEVVAHLGVSLCVVSVKGLGEIRVLTHS